MRACDAADACDHICRNIDKTLAIPKKTSAHTKKTTTKDLEVAMNVLRKVGPFNYTKGRNFEGFSKIHKSPRNIVKRPDLVNAIHKKIQRLYLNC